MADTPDPGSKALKEMPPPPPASEVSDGPSASLPEATSPSASQMVQSPPLQEVADGWDKAIQDLNKKKKGASAEDKSDSRNAGSSSGNDSVVASEVLLLTYSSHLLLSFTELQLQSCSSLCSRSLNPTLLLTALTFIRISVRNNNYPAYNAIHSFHAFLLAAGCLENVGRPVDGLLSAGGTRKAAP